MVVSDQQKFHLMSCKNPEPAPQPGWGNPNNSGAPHIIYTMHKLRHGLTRGSQVRQIMTIHDGLGGGVTRLWYDIIYEQICLKKTTENSLNVRMFFKLGSLATFL